MLPTDATAPAGEKGGGGGHRCPPNSAPPPDGKRRTPARRCTGSCGGGGRSPRSESRSACVEASTNGFLRCRLSAMAAWMLLACRGRDRRPVVEAGEREVGAEVEGERERYGGRSPGSESRSDCVEASTSGFLRCRLSTLAAPGLPRPRRAADGGSRSVCVRERDRLT
ncbi:hypothetical protein C2845_PM02G18200 [Panicum miliaceum]|uniref:Uncharacterized protein n=1 Tax=Panicum miliaceum TaxID=4540 RepID=A0A3L6SEA8_PANMI|nr:hypothetical protein C2845_PM02G18200 [Panicum miliaceum]